MTAAILNSETLFVAGFTNTVLSHRHAPEMGERTMEALLPPGLREFLEMAAYREPFQSTRLGRATGLLRGAGQSKCSSYAA